MLFGRNFLDAERLSRYYGTLAERYRRRHRWWRYGLLLASTGVVADVLDLLPIASPGLAAVSGAVIAALVLWESAAGYATKAAVLHAIGIECQEFVLELRRLWGHTQRGDMDSAAVRLQLNDIETGLLRITARPGEADIDEDEQLNMKSAEEGYQVIRDRMMSREGSGA